MKKKSAVQETTPLSEKQNRLHQQIGQFILDIKRPKDAREAATQQRQSIPAEILPLIL